MARSDGPCNKQPEHPSHQKDGCRDKIDSARQSALLESADIAPEISENGFAADRAALHHSCQCLRVRLVAPRASQARIECQESVDRNGPVSHENGVAPTIEKCRETLRCGGNAARFWRERVIADSCRCFRASPLARLHPEAVATSSCRASPLPNRAVCQAGWPEKGGTRILSSPRSNLSQPAHILLPGSQASLHRRRS